MSSPTQEVLAEMVDAIVAEVDPEQVILFGSQARGDHGEESDIDLLVIQSEPFKKVGKRDAQSVRLSRRLARFSVPTDILLYGRDEVDYWRDSLNHVVARALREGKVLYERH